MICFRVVTRGDYPDLVRANVANHIEKCLRVGLNNFIVEIVTEKSMSFITNKYIKEIIIPKHYETKSGAIFKARALQYCLDIEDKDMLDDNDWIVHLDEETIMSEDAIKGIVNFVCNGKHDFGQGVITYAENGIHNVWTTLMDTNRVADDMGKVKFQFKFFNKPVFSWKGSYFVCRAKAERTVTFNHGIDGSIAEDCYFALKAYQIGYTFDWIEGQMWEQSPFTIKDFIRQRKRWMQGIYLVLLSPDIHFKYKIWVAMTFHV
ncbi:beta-1,4-mannosyltransferase egh-like [Oppia nitens]|uniref:beta-1,4-mannosyltransferase egh-like n=1 Tax=Oppia nitens TaxID=1686743 RepID=UPI0023DC644A|nr:beta-1,4-mannosyltransferase egh-like [Oppia nitens]